MLLQRTRYALGPSYLRHQRAHQGVHLRLDWAQCFVNHQTGSPNNPILREVAVQQGFQSPSVSPIDPEDILVAGESIKQLVLLQ